MQTFLLSSSILSLKNYREREIFPPSVHSAILSSHDSSGQISVERSTFLSHFANLDVCPAMSAFRYWERTGRFSDIRGGERKKMFSNSPLRFRADRFRNYLRILIN